MSILFMEDWLKKPGSSIHYETKNPSFLRLAEVFYKMGVKNCAFHLALLNPNLRHVDPHSPDLTEGQKRDIKVEVKRNYWYFLREVIRVDSPGSIDGAPFRANRSNIALFWLYLNHITTIITVIRQTGKSTNLLSQITWLLNGGTIGSYIGLLTKDGALRTKTMAGLKEMFEYLPPYLNMARKTDTFTSEKASVDSMKNTIVGLVSNSSPKAADKVGRGFTISSLFVDEVAFVENIEIALSAISMSGNAARTIHREEGKPFGTVMATTAGDIDSRDGRFVYTLLSNSTLFSELLYDAKDEEGLIKLIESNSSAKNERDRKLIVNLTLSYRQMGFSEEWMKEKIRESTSSDENIERDLFNRWVSGTGTSPIPEKDRKRLEEGEVEDPIRRVFDPYNFMLNWYITEEELSNKFLLGHHLVIGVDTSDLVGQDDTSFYIRDHATGEIVCGGLFNDSNLITMADFFTEFLDMYRQSTMIIERKSSGVAIIDYMIQKLLLRGINPFTRLYNSIFQDTEKYQKEYREIINSRLNNDDVFNKYRDHIGFKTAGAGVNARSMLFGTTLINMTKYTADTTRDHWLIRQLMGLIVKNGRVDHVAGGHDDAVVAALLSYWFLTMGRNLELYGIDKGLLLKKNDVYLNDRYTNMRGENDRKKMELVETEIGFLLETMREETDVYIIDKLEARIRFLSRNIEVSGKHISVEGMLEDIKKTKRLNSRRR